MANAIEQANKNWREGNRIGQRLELTAEEVSRFLSAKGSATGCITIREDMQVGYRKNF